MELLHIFDQCNELGELYFFDNTIEQEKVLFDRFKVLFSEEELANIFTRDNRFVLGLGNPGNRFRMAIMLVNIGGALNSIISPVASVGNFGVHLGIGLNIMSHVVIYNNVTIGDGVLLNTASSIHHDVSIGKYCEICPGARVLGGVSIGDFSFIGSGAVVLPGTKIGRNCIIGAGSLVTKDVYDGEKVFGVPARLSNNQ